ncbi:CoxG family protein [Lutimaribacter marinistellae]|uniref:CoxG family protein n=1 Tax=Lutimaribacter marinistellae TaxID=1820329 RepID=A0ABV7TEP7_9RHOB
MHMSDEKEIAAPRETVYAALLDPEMLKACVPGAQEVSGNPQDGYEAVVTQKVGPVKATFKGQVTMSDMVENEKLTIAGEGKGGAAGFAKGGAQVTLSDTEAGGTLLAYEVDAKVGGKLAQLGSRLIDGFAKKMADQFFSNLQQQIEGPAEEGADGADEAPEIGKKGWFGLRKGKA